MQPEFTPRRAWTADEIRRLGYRAVDLIADHLAGLPDRPVFRPFPPVLAQEFLTSPPPARGATAESVLAEFADKVAPYPFGNGHPRFWGWVNSPPVVIGVLAEALAAAMDPSCAGGNHSAIYVERQVINWFRQVVGFPPESMGLLVSGGSMAGLTALAVARHTGAGFDVRPRGLQGGGPRLTLYLSAESHGCLRKAAELLGVGSDNVRLIPVDGQFRMRVDALEAAIAADLAAGCRPVAVSASFGTVNTGAIDPLADVAAVCRRHRLWLHVDGAYGAPAVLTGRYPDEAAALAQADSVALDPHKWLYIPVEAGLVLVRDGAAMRDAFSLVPPYLRTDDSPTGVGGPPWFSEYGFQQTRGFRALKVWMALKHYGLEGYRHSIAADLDLAARLAEQVAAARDLELVAQGLSTVCFRYAPDGLQGDEGRLDALNKALLEEVQQGGEAFLSSTVLGGRFVLRACIVNHRTAPADIDFLGQLVRRTGARLMDRASGVG